MSDTILHINNSGALILKNALPAPGWYEGQSIKVSLSAIEVAENLSEVKPPERPKNLTETSAREWRKAVEAWGAEPYDVTVSKKQLDAIKTCLDKTLAKNPLALTIKLRVDPNGNLVPAFAGLFDAVYFPGPGEIADAKHRAKITKGAALLLRSAVEQPGWYQSVSEGDRAKTLQAAFALARVCDQAGEPAEDEDGMAWANEEYELPMSEKQRDTAKTVVKHFLEKAQLTLTKHVRALIRELGLDSE